MSNMVPCVALAMCTGLVYTAGVCVVSIPPFRARRKRPPAKLSGTVTTGLTVLYVLLMIFANVPMISAVSFGPVSVVVPVSIAAYLLSNMVMQLAEGMNHYSKSMVIGTIVLSLSAMQLVDVGPSDPIHYINPMVMVDQPAAKAWLLTMFVLMVCGLALLPFFRNAGPSSIGKLFAYAAVVGIMAAFNNSLSKMLTKLVGTQLYIIIGVYVVLGLSSAYFSALGNTVLDNTLSVPVFSCVQVIVNGFTGIIVWGDGDRIENWTAYAIIYLLFCLGIYLCSSADHIVAATRWHALSNISTDRKSASGFIPIRLDSDLGLSMAELLRAMHSASTQNDYKKGLAAKLGIFLEQGTKDETVSQFELVQLCNALASSAEDSDPHKLSAILAIWAEKYCQDFQYILNASPDLKTDLDNIRDASEPLLRI